MRNDILSDELVRHKLTEDEIELAVHDMAAAGYTVLSISHAVKVHLDMVKTLLALDVCE